jgi:hypothetical protein
MWINMNEETLIALSGITLVVAFAILPAIALQIILYKLYLKFRATKEKKRLETQAVSTQQEPSVSPQSASPRRSVASLIVMTLLVLVRGLGVGITVGVFSHLLYIVFLLPLVMGIHGGKMIVDVIQKVKIRTASQLILLSLLSTIIIYGAFHYTRYMGFQVKASLEIFSGLSEATEEENLKVTRAFLDYALEEETGHSGFLGYMLYEAKTGVSIGRLSRSSSSNLGPVLTWLYWLMEFGIILGVTFQKGKKLIHRPFCESCGNWYGAEKHLGGTATANESLVLDLIRQKDFAGLGKLIEKNAEVPSLELYYQGCQICGQSQSQLVVRHALQNGKGVLQFSDAAQMVLQPRESTLLLSQLSPTGD